MDAQIEGGLFVFYDRFIQLCKERNIKPTPLIVELGLSSSNAAQWKKGSTPRPQVLQRIADYFDVPVAYFYETEQKEKTPTESDERDILDEVDIGFYHGFKELTEDDKETVRDMVRIMRRRRAQQGFHD